MSQETQFTRRAVLGAAALAAGACTEAAPPPEEARARNGRIRQSLVYWCLNGTEWAWDIDRICEAAKTLGCVSVELVPPDLWPKLKEHGLESSIAMNGMPDPPFVKGLNNPRYHEEVIARTKQEIERAADFGIQRVIAFNGFKWKDAEDPTSGEISLEEGLENCVKGLSELAPFAAQHGVTICLEQLNTRDDTHPMKGHPGYQGDDIDYCAEIMRRVDSPNVKLLFDIYHVQIMNGDVIRRIRQYKDYLGHIHTAGNPGRGELDAKLQEIAYPAVMQALLEVGYQGYVGQEFIPTREPMEGLTAAVTQCDV